MENDKKIAYEEQIDGCRYSAWDFGLRAETNFYLKRVPQIGKSLITSNTQSTDSSLIVVSRRMVRPRVVA